MVVVGVDEVMVRPMRWGWLDRRRGAGELCVITMVDCRSVNKVDCR